jgi:hypothetical protein
MPVNRVADVLLVKVSPLVTTLAEAETNSVQWVYVKFSWSRITNTAATTSGGELYTISKFPLHFKIPHP